MSDPIPFEQTHPQAAEFLARLYAKGLCVRMHITTGILPRVIGGSVRSFTTVCSATKKTTP